MKSIIIQTIVQNREVVKWRNIERIVTKKLNVEKKDKCQRHVAFPGGHPSKY